MLIKLKKAESFVDLAKRAGFVDLECMSGGEAPRSSTCFLGEI